MYAHYKSMATESCHSNQSSYLTGTKHSRFVEANARKIYAKNQLHNPNSFWREDAVGLFSKIYIFGAPATNQNKVLGQK